MSINKQKENIAILLNLIAENPDIEILPMVDRDCVFDDSFSYWMGNWGSAEVTKYWISDERVYQYNDFDELVEEWIDNNYEDYPGIADYELEEMAKKVVSEYEWVDAIVVYVNSL